jgi:two-component system, chemotaxis family, chemotaxis protein CheY
MNILIVDDSGVMRRIHKGILLEHGVAESDIIEAEDGKAALAVARATTIGLFLVDWNMPNLNGLEFTRTLRSMDAYKTTPIVMITSEAAKYNVVEAIQAGVTNYVVKPIKGKALFEKIGKFLEGQG